MTKTVATPRSQAIDILCEWQSTGQSIDIIKDKQNSFHDQRDNQLTSALVFGVLRQRGHLDWLLGKFSSHPLNKMKPLVLQALRVGLYQLLYMDRIPPSAAINETVQVVKKRGEPKWLCGFVNGLLRNVSRRIAASNLKFDLPPHAKLSHPEWLIKRWQKRWGKEKTAEICCYNNTPAQLTLCINSRKIDRDTFRKKLHNLGITAESGVFSSDALILDDYHGPVVNLCGFEEGLFHVQDEMAQLVVSLLGSFSAGSYLDACAGLGGKTSLLAQKMVEGSHVTAVEPQSGRNLLMQENMARLGLTDRVEIFSADLNSFANSTDKLFRGVLVDAPCSGTGVIRRHPDIRWNRQPDDFVQFQEKQLAIMMDAARLTAPGGVLVYATCSMEPEENEEVVDLFLREQTQFQVETGADYLPPGASGLINSRGFLATTPGADCSDGFFAARLVKEDGGPM